MAFNIGSIVGGAIAIFLVSRLLGWLTKRWRDTFKKSLLIDMLAFALAIIVGGYGAADGGPPRFDYAAQAYLVPTLIVIALDAIRHRRMSKA